MILGALKVWTVVLDHILVLYKTSENDVQ